MRTLPLVCLLLTSTTALGDDWTPLFDGKSLAGWRANTAPESFAVVDGAIRVRAVGPTASHLFALDAAGPGDDAKREFARYVNFELEVVARSEPNGNSGIFVHTDDKPRPGRQLFLANGHEIQLNSTAKEKKKTGSLYGVVDLATSPVDETQWFTTKIVVNGRRITVSIDGKQVVDYTEPEGVKRPADRAGRVLRPDGGAIALQAHDPGSIWYFKSVRVKRLP